MCPDEYVICSTFFTIASTGTHHTVYAGRNRGVGGGRRNSVGGFGVGSGVVFEVLGGVDVSFVRFEVGVSFFSSILATDICNVA